MISALKLILSFLFDMITLFIFFIFIELLLT